MVRLFAWALLALLASVAVPAALAQSTIDYPDQGAAYAGCQGNAASALPFQVNAGLERIACSASKTKQPTCRLVGANVYRIYGVNRDKNNGDESGSCFDLTGQAAGVNTHRFQTGKTCSSRAPLLNVSYQGNLAGCNSGCEVAAGIGEPGDTVTVLGSGTSAITRVSRMVPTGQTCTVGAEYQNVQPQTTDQCQQQGNLTQCVTADGRTCAVASSGKKFCWEPSEAGIKVSGNEAAVKSPENATIKQPPKAPANGGDWQQGGTGAVSVTSGGVTNNYNTTNYNSTYGSQGSGANGGGADGEGNGGSGEGEGEGNGSASGGGTCSQPYVCSGDPIMCSLGQQMWLSRCGDRKGDGNGDGIPDALVGDAPQNPDPGEDVNPTRWGINVGADMLDTENIFGDAGCPLMPSFTIMGQTVNPSEFPQWCTLVAVMRAVVLLMGAFIAIGLLMGGS